MAVVAIVAGDGLAKVFASMGASAIVPGGQTIVCGVISDKCEEQSHMQPYVSGK